MWVVVVMVIAVVVMVVWWRADCGGGGGGCGGHSFGIVVRHEKKICEAPTPPLSVSVRLLLRLRGATERVSGVWVCVKDYLYMTSLDKYKRKGKECRNEVGVQK